MKEFYSQNNLPQAVHPSCPVHRVLEGQKAIVTGSSSGIGKAVAIELAKAGADVLIKWALL